MVTIGERLSQQAEQQNALWLVKCRTKMQEEYRELVTKWIPRHAAADGQFSMDWNLQYAVGSKCSQFLPQLHKELSTLAALDRIKVTDGLYPETVSLHW